MADMIKEQLKLSKGRWLSVNCGSTPESKCHLVMMAPETDKNDLIEAVSMHVIKRHGGSDTRELRGDVAKMITSLTV